MLLVFSEACLSECVSLPSFLPSFLVPCVVSELVLSPDLTMPLFNGAQIARFFFFFFFFYFSFPSYPSLPFEPSLYVKSRHTALWWKCPKGQIIIICVQRSIAVLINHRLLELTKASNLPLGKSNCCFVSVLPPLLKKKKPTFIILEFWRAKSDIGLIGYLSFTFMVHGREF